MFRLVAGAFVFTAVQAIVFTLVYRNHSYRLGFAYVLAVQFFLVHLFYGRQAMVPSRLPALFLPHGGGPLPLLGDPSHAKLTAWLKRYAQDLPRPKAICVVSAHWEEAAPRVTAARSPQLIYDYHGFPPESYKLQWPAPGSPALAAKVCSLLRGAGFACEEDPARGFDHGVFVPLKLAFPEAEIPTVQLSLVKGLDPAAHVAMGAALAPLRDEGVLLVGSGMTFHNLPVLMGAGRPGDALSRSKEFDEWLETVLTGPGLAPEQRREALQGWATAPQAAYAHPREEHLLPLMVVLGAAGADPGKVCFSDTLLGAHTSGFRFG